MPRVCIVIVYFGNWPRWFSAWLRSCETNVNFQWLIFSDSHPPLQLPQNVRIERMSKEELESQVSQMLSTPFVLSKGYKLVDLKPAYGELFREHLQGFDFWGYTDMDLVYGRLSDFFTPERFSSYDVLSPSDRLLVGHLTLIRNTHELCTLYRRCPDYLSILCRDEHEGFDEKGFHRLVMYLASVGELRLFLKDMKQEDIILRLLGRQKFLIVWRKGKLYDVAGFREICHFHFMESKWGSGFRVLDVSPDTQTFYLTPDSLVPATSLTSWTGMFLHGLEALLFSLPFHFKSSVRRLVPKRVMHWFRSCRSSKC